MDRECLREHIKSFVRDTKNGYMFSAMNLEKQPDGMSYVRRLHNRKPSPRSREIPTLDWCRQFNHKVGLNFLDQSLASPICAKMKEDLTSLGYNYKEEVIVPIRDKTFGIWRDCLRKHGVNEETMKGNKSYFDSWYKQFFVLDIVETKTGAIIETDGRTYHNPVLDAARDEYIKIILGEDTRRFVGYGLRPKERQKDLNSLKTLLEEKSPSSILPRILEENIGSAVDFYYCEGDRDRFSIPVFLRMCQSLSEGWREETTLHIPQSKFQLYCKDAKVRDSLALRRDLETAIFKNLFGIVLKIENP